jgi:hypothetical protein
MIVSCNLCGGENKVHPGQKMLFCSFCGSALAIQKERSLEHLILPHERNDRGAGEALRSYLLSKRRGRCEIGETRFAYLPFVLVEEENGRTRIVPASKETRASVSYPPSGNYQFFDETLAGNETVVPLSDEAVDGERLLHLPVYDVSYHVGRFEGKADVIGESWQVQTDVLPAETGESFDFSRALKAAALFTLFLFIGKLVPGWLARFALTMIAAAAGYAILTIREKAVKRA